ncbi:hypothetical protein D3C84_629930 [compost metagenome]
MGFEQFEGYKTGQIAFAVWRQGGLGCAADDAQQLTEITHRAANRDLRAFRQDGQFRAVGVGLGAHIETLVLGVDDVGGRFPESWSREICFDIACPVLQVHIQAIDGQCGR